MYREMNLKDRGFAREHLRALSNQAGKAWWVRRTHGGAATGERSSVLPLVFGFGSVIREIGPNEM